MNKYMFYTFPPALPLTRPPVSMDDDLGGPGAAEEAGLLAVVGGGVWAEEPGTVWVAPGQEEVPNLQPVPLLVLQEGGVVQVSALVVLLHHLHT